MNPDASPASRSWLRRDALAVSPATKLAYALSLTALLVHSTMSFVQALGRDPGRPDIVDFHVFDIVGRLVWAGRLAEAYGRATMLPLEHAVSVVGGYMTFSYPPLFAVILAPLAKLPPGVAFASFVLVTLAAYVLVMRRIGGQGVWPVLLALTPSVMINVQSGQNGLLTGALVGAAALSTLAGRPVATASAVAAMAIKPHLALMLPLVLLVERRWLALVLSAAGALALTLASIAVFGTRVFSAFLASLGEVQHYMDAGGFPFHRMPTIYAFVKTLGLSGATASAAHALVASGVVATTAWAALRIGDPRVRIGLLIMATPFVSPYFYDYDWTVFGIGLALAAPWLALTLTTERYVTLLFVLAFGETIGMVQNTFFKLWSGFQVSVTGPLLLGCFLLILAKAVQAGQPIQWSGLRPRAEAMRDRPAPR